MTAEYEQGIRKVIDSGQRLGWKQCYTLLRELDETRDMLASCRKERSELQAKVWGQK